MACCVWYAKSGTDLAYAASRISLRVSTAPPPRWSLSTATQAEGPGAACAVHVLALRTSCFGTAQFMFWRCAVHGLALHSYFSSAAQFMFGVLS
eukprot:2837206-Rhodomonas_salina.1